MPRKRVALLGASGFVGSSVRASLEGEHDVVVIPSPRMTTKHRNLAALVSEAARSPWVEQIALQLSGVDALVNAAGFPDASSLDEDLLLAANALLPAIALEAARKAGVPRMVHISSAVVQNDKPVLDATENVQPFSPYSFSKVTGELVLRSAKGVPPAVVIYRPPSVHAPGRRVTRMISRIASSRLASVARPGNQPTPQAQLPNVGAAVAFLATMEKLPPPVVVHPWEGVTVTSLMQDLGGGRTPHRIPQGLARALVRFAKLGGRIHRPTAANARRLELLWLGQAQAESWLTQEGWRPPVGLDGWRQLGARFDGGPRR